MKEEISKLNTVKQAYFNCSTITGEYIGNAVQVTVCGKIATLSFGGKTNITLANWYSLTEQMSNGEQTLSEWIKENAMPVGAVSDFKRSLTAADRCVYLKIINSESPQISLWLVQNDGISSATEYHCTFTWIVE